MTPEEYERILYTGKKTYQAGSKNTGKSEIKILQEQKSKLIDMVKQLMSYELPNTDFGYTYQQECFKAAKKLLEELK